MNPSAKFASNLKYQYLFLILGLAFLQGCAQFTNTTLAPSGGPTGLAPDTGCEQTALAQFEYLNSLPEKPSEKEMTDALIRIETQRETCHYRNSVICAYDYQSMRLSGIASPMCPDNYAASARECEAIDSDPSTPVTGQASWAEFRKEISQLPILSTYLRNECYADRANVVMQGMLGAGDLDPKDDAGIKAAARTECQPLTAGKSYISLYTLLTETPFKMCVAKAISNRITPATIG